MPEQTNEKRCPCCGDTKPLSEFYVRPRNEQTGASKRVGSYCKPCVKRVVREHYVANRERALERGAARRRLRNYGLTPEAHEALLRRANGKSELSGTTFASDSYRGNSSHIDHFNDLNGIPVVRGLITARENQAIGLLGHDPELCIDAAQYLYRHIFDLRELCQT